MVITFTKHAERKVEQRKITIDDIKGVIENPDVIEPDRYDSSLVHYIKHIGERYLRVIGRWESRDNVLVISAFLDRRLKKRKHDDAKT
jgi:hypothetical protein